MTTIEQAFAAIAAEHNLTVVELSLRPNPAVPEYVWSMTFHRDGYSRKGNTCISAFGATPADALEAAIIQLKADRIPVTLNDATVDFAVAA